MMSSVTGETVNGTFINLQKERSDAELGSFIYSINNHAVFAQNIVKESKNGKLSRDTDVDHKDNNHNNDSKGNLRALKHGKNTAKENSFVL